MVKPVQQDPAPIPAPVQKAAAPAPAPRFSNFEAIPATPSRPAAPARLQQKFRVRARVPQQQQQPQFAPQPKPQPPQFAPQQPAAAPANTNPHFAGLRFQFQIQAPEFNYQNNFAENAYAFSSPFYSTNAQGGTYSYAAIY